MSSQPVPMQHAPVAKRAAPPIPLLSLGFRAFYPLAGLAALLLLPAWLLVFFGILPQHPGFGGPAWHAHEMLFGYTVAVLVGFLYTAVPNWTGLPTPRGATLGGLALLWLAGRAAMLAGGMLPGALVATIDVAFLPLAALGVLLPLWRKRNTRNILFPVGMLVLAVLNLCMHLIALGILEPHVDPMQVALGIITLVLVVMTGRVVPFFTGNALPQAGAQRTPRLDQAALAAVAASLVAQAAFPDTLASAVLALLAGALLLYRMIWWKPLATRVNAMLWVLHLGHFWIALAFLMRGAYALGVPMAASLPDHALTVGAIGGLTLGMMARSGLGHSGRRIVAGPLLVTSFVAINVAAWARVLAPWMVPSHFDRAMIVAGVAWVLAFALFLVVMVPVCVRRRADQ